MKILFTHGGFVVFSKKWVYKFSFGSRVRQLYNQQNRFYNESNKEYLLHFQLIFLSNFILIYKEHVFCFQDEILVSHKSIFSSYSKLVNENIRMINKLNSETFLQNNFYRLRNKKYKLKIFDIINEINTKTTNLNIGLIHGDFWRENILTDKKHIYFIDYDRSRDYSFIEFDLINFFIFNIVYKEKPHWNNFISITQSILIKESVYYELIDFINEYHPSKNKNDLIIDDLIKLYILKLLYDNNSFLNTFQYLNWYKYRLKVEKLLWD